MELPGPERENPTGDAFPPVDGSQELLVQQAGPGESQPARPDLSTVPAGWTGRIPASSTGQGPTSKSAGTPHAY